MPVLWQFRHENLSGSLPATGASETRIRFYAISIAANVGLAYFCWAGVHWNGGKLSDITGSGLFSKLGVLLDLLTTFGFFVIWEAVARGTAYLVGPDQAAESIGALLPTGIPQIAMWVSVSFVAGICEEMVFRGYLLRQFRAMTGRNWVAIVFQAVLFGAIHFYKGWRQVAVIFPLGILYGVLAARKRNLRANMLAHAWTDIYEGCLRAI